VTYIDWLKIHSDSETYNFKDISETKSSVVWLGDSPPKLELNQLDDGEKTLPQYEFGIGGFICNTIIDSGAGAVYLECMVAQELYERREIDIVYVNPQNVRLGNGHVEQVRMKAKFKLCIDNNQMSVKAFLINLPEMDLVLGLPWLCLTEVVPDYNTLSYTFIDNKNQVVNVRPYNNLGRSQAGLNTVIGTDKIFSHKLEELAYKTALDTFREIVGLPKDKAFKHDIDTGNVAAVKVHG
jgi:hypothetical protein